MLGIRRPAAPKPRAWRPGAAAMAVANADSGSEDAAGYPSHMQWKSSYTRLMIANEEPVINCTGGGRGDRQGDSESGPQAAEQDD
jgi:hypothetical protein